jgi:SAM-dependent methyltransferase
MIYGAEPGVAMHAALRERVAKAGLEGKYCVLNCGAEEESLLPALAKEGLLGKGGEGLDEGVFDEIVCIRVLCGVPRPGETVRGLYRCLKPGGRFLLFEHVVNDAQRGNGLGWFLQRIYSALGWSFLMSGCDLRRNTAASLIEAAKEDEGWAKVQLETIDEWSTLPHIFGYCIKKA